MKEKELDRCLESLIVEGLIKESEMEGVEFAAAMRHISDDAFYAIIRSREEEDASEESEPDMSDASAKESLVKYDCVLPSPSCDMAICFERAQKSDESRFEKSLVADGDDWQSLGMKLVVDHIRDRRREAAIDVLKRLIERGKGTPFGDSCEDLLSKLE
jgi:hypothetical protein